MRASDLIGGTVVDAAGKVLGRIHDFTVVQDGPLGAGTQAGFRVDELHVGRGTLAERLGYGGRGVERPVALRWVLTIGRSRVRRIRWTDVAT